MLYNDSVGLHETPERARVMSGSKVVEARLPIMLFAVEFEMIRVAPDTGNHAAVGKIKILLLDMSGSIRDHTG